MKDLIKVIILIGLLIIAALQACEFNLEAEEIVTPDKFAAETNLKDDVIQMIVNQPVPLNVLANDTKLQNSTLVFSTPQHGNIQIDSTAGGFLYVPAPDFKGKDIFTYRVCGAGSCEYATVQIHVQ